MVDVEDLVNAKEIARRLGVVPSVVSNWRKRYPDFPKPLGASGGKGGVYVYPEIEEWVANRPWGKHNPKPPTPIGGRLDAYEVTTTRAPKALGWFSRVKPYRGEL